MARLEYEVQAVRDRDGDLATGVAYQVYTDEAATSLADISATSGGSAIAGSTVVVADIAGLGPSALRWWGPPAGTDELYLKTASDPTLPVQKVEAVTDQRLDALEAAVDALEASGTQVWAIDPEQTPYNADGTGGTDTYTAWTTAISDAISQKRPIVSKPGKTYRINAKLTISGSVVIDLNGSSLKKGTSFNDYAVHVTGTDVTLRNVVVDGNRSGGALGSGIFWAGARGKAFDSASSHHKAQGWVVYGASATLEAVRCVGSDNVSGALTGSGWFIGGGAILTSSDCEASDNDYAGFFLADALAGCRLDGKAHRNGHAGARIDGTPAGTIPSFFAQDDNDYGLLMIGAAVTEWQVGTVTAKGIGNAIAAFGLTADGNGSGVQLIGPSECSFGHIDTSETWGYGLAISEQSGAGGTKNRVGTVVCREAGDPAVLFSTGAKYNHIGLAVVADATFALNFGEGSAPANHNSIGTLVAEQCDFGAILFNDGNDNYIDRCIARNIATSDPTNIAKGVVQFGKISESIPVTGNAVGWLDYRDAAGVATDPQYLAHANATAVGNRIDGRQSAAVTVGLALDLNGGNRLSFLPDKALSSGAGSPEGVLTAPVGSLYLRTDGGAGTIAYTKNTGTGNTGWGALT